MKPNLFCMLCGAVFFEPVACAMDLYEAARAGDVERVRALVTGADLSAQDGAACTPLHAAARKGCEASVRLLLEHGAPVDQQDRRGRTPLYWAARGKHEHVARLLLESGADVNCPDDYGRTPLHWVAFWGYKPVALLLLDHGARQAVRDDFGRTPLYRAFQAGKHSVARLLKKWPVRVQNMKSAQLALCMALHQRLGQRSAASILSQPLVREICQYLRPSDFLARALPEH